MNIQKFKNLTLIAITFIALISIASGQTACPGLRTYTQGGWGAAAKGNNAGTYRDAHFAAAFPNGLTIGCGNNTRTFTTAAQIEAFLPAGGTAAVLPATSVLAGQLVAAMLNVGFDAYDANFAASNVSLGTMYTDNSAFSGMTLNQIIAAANQAIGGCSTSNLASLNTVLTTINENFDNGTQDNGHVFCNYAHRQANTTENDLPSMEVTLYPNPAGNFTHLNFHTESDTPVTVTLYNLNGQVISVQEYTAVTGNSEMVLDLNAVTNQTCLVRITGDNINITKMVIVQK